MATQDREDALIQRVRRITDLSEEPLEFLSVITGYEILPIVSIDEAVKPLVSILPIVESQTYIAKMNCQDRTNGLTQDEAASIMLYTMEWEPSSLYTVLNATLRMKDRSKLKPWFLYMKLFFAALDRLPPTSARSLYRGVKLDLSNQYKLGKTVVWWGFSSCTVSIGVSESEQFLGRTGQRTMFHIECHSRKDIRQHSYLRDEDEVLVLPATQFEVVGCLQLTSGLQMIHLKEVQPPVPLRAPLLTSSRDVITLSAQNSPPTEQATTFIWSTKPPTTGSKLVQESATTSFTTILCDNPRLAKIIKRVQTDSTIKQLDLWDNEISTDGAKYLADALQNNQTITRLDLGKNNIGDEGAKYLANALRNNQTVTQLNVSWNSIDTDGAKHLADTLRNNQTITQLDLSLNSIGVKGARYLADILPNNHTITQLDLQDNEIGAEGAKYLADALRKNQTITELNAHTNAIGAEGAKHLADALRKNQVITQLNLSRNRIGTEGAKYLADALQNNQTIVQLDLSLNEIGDEGAKHLADAFRKNQTITQLNVSLNRIGDEGAKHLAGALRNNQTIVLLNLRENKIGDQGIEYLVDALLNNQMFLKLDLYGNEFGDEGRKCLDGVAKIQNTSSQLEISLASQKPKQGFFQRAVKFFGAT